MTGDALKVGAGVDFSGADTLRTTLATLKRLFAHHGLPSPDIDARFLLSGVLGIDDLDYLKAPARLLGNDVAKLRSAVVRRLAREPVSRILGERMFYGRSFEVTPDVLDPRPETETLIEVTLALIREAKLEREPITIADVGTGSGAILVTMLSELPMARGIATDLSRAALEVAMRNARRHGVDDRFEAMQTRGLSGLTVTPDIIISNPPYIPSAEIDRLDPEVKDYDPRLALDGGSDGLEVYREISREISGMRGVRAVVLEVGSGQSEDVERLFSQAPGALGLSLRHYKDLGGHVRCVTIQPKS